MLEELKNVAAEAAKARADFIERTKEQLKPAFLSVLDAHPCIKAFGWTQYTPYFNDGAPCEFRVNDVHASSADERDDDIYGEGWEEFYGEAKEGFTQEAWDALKELQDIISSAGDAMESAFGDHVVVIVTREGVTVDEYEHD
jgi:hypothetical protein